MNIFESLKRYADSWEVINSRMFDTEEIESVTHAKVVESQYGLSACFFMKGGGQKYIPMSRDSVVSIGEEIDMSKAKLLVLHREGEDDIVRVEI